MTTDDDGPKCSPRPVGFAAGKNYVVMSLAHDCPCLVAAADTDIMASALLLEVLFTNLTLLTLLAELELGLAATYLAGKSKLE